MWRVSLLFVGGCSFAFMSTPSPVMQPTCNAGYEAPIVDTVIGGAAFGLSSVIAGAFALETVDERVVAPLFLLVPMALGYGSSAVYGYLSRSRCEHARNAR